MDSIDATKILIGRIEKLEPENVPEIVGFILMHELREDLIRLVHSPDMVMQEKVQEAKLHLANRGPMITRSRTYSSPIPIATNPCWSHHLVSDHQKVLNPDYASLGYQDLSSQDYNNRLSCSSTQSGQFLSSEDTGGIHGGLGGHISSTPSLTNFSLKTCHYFNKGYCKHGSKCRYIHGGSNHSPRSLPDSLSRTLLIDGGGTDDPSFLSGSLENLEAEITQLLKSRRGNPVSIASLPMIYQEKYGRSLQAEGYLTESQRHGRAGYSLTKLLARLKSICLFERPHGQHFVILAEDAAKYSLDNHNERKDPGPIVAGSRQIYLTFPADSTFTEEDVSTHFSSFGAVEDVRIPCQQKRMFGFVTFLCPKTVKTVLNKGNPHFVCGARVLVKPYREKSKLVDRKYMEKPEQHMYQNYQANYFNWEPDTHSMLRRRYEAPRFSRRQIMEDQERALELETRHLPTPPYVNYITEELGAAEEEAKFLSDERFNHWIAVFTNKSTKDDKSRQAEGGYLGQESLPSSNQVIKLPDSPFEAQLQQSISTVM